MTMFLSLVPKLLGAERLLSHVSVVKWSSYSDQGIYSIVASIYCVPNALAAKRVKIREADDLIRRY